MPRPEYEEDSEWAEEKEATLVRWCSVSECPCSTSACPEDDECLALVELAGVDGRLPPPETWKAGGALGEGPEKPDGWEREELPWLKSSLRAWGI